MTFHKQSRTWVIYLLMAVLAGLAYLPHMGSFGYHRDDWYLMYSANALGPDVFHDIYAIDRPVRAYLMSVLYSIFGVNPLYYNISAFFFRLLGAIAFFRTLGAIWPRQRMEFGVAAALFLVYPGFISTPNAIDYQAQQAGLFLAMGSILCSVEAVYSLSIYKKLMFWISSILMTWTYLGFVEYFLGLEILRLALILVIVLREKKNEFRQISISLISKWFPVAIGPLGFVIWRFFLFESARKATDLGAQFGAFNDAPLLVGGWWFTNLIRNSFEVLVLSWGLPLAALWDIDLRLREVFFVVVLSAITIFVAQPVLRIFGDGSVLGDDENRWQSEAAWVGFISLAAGFIPVILSNRDANFSNFSRYMLASSAGATIVLASFLGQFNSRRTLNITVCMLLVVSVLTHFFNGIQWSRASQNMDMFWWQVSWRVPQIEPGTTLIVNYSGASPEEDYFIWGPSNLIYHPQSTAPDDLRPALSGLVLTRENLNAILGGLPPETINRRSIITITDYNDVLILSKPTTFSCVQVIDGSNPLVSEYEEYNISIISEKSNIDNVLVAEKNAIPSESIFGAEPRHEWCYFYETASLAYQRGDFESVVDMMKSINQMNLSPSDPVEWMPFIQAAAKLGDTDTIADLAVKVKKSEFLTQQACRQLTSLADVDKITDDFIRSKFCVSPG